VPPAATVVWVMMIVGFAVTAGRGRRACSTRIRRRAWCWSSRTVVGGRRGASALLALLGVERTRQVGRRPARRPQPPFLRGAAPRSGREPDARRFTDLRVRVDAGLTARRT
jgi:hypothetical protein